MKRVVISEAHQLALIDVDDPQPQDGEVLLKVKTIGICGSDLHVFEGHHPFVTYPVMPGHEVSGEIIAVGAGVDESLIGRNAVIEPSLPEGERPRFEPGRYNIASELKVMGFQVPGAMAEYFALSLDRIHLVPDHFTHDMGAVVEPTAVAVHGLRLAGNIAGLNVGVIGAGSIGLLTAQIAKAYNAASVTVAEFDDHRRNVSETLGFNTTRTLAEQQFDVVFECVGVESSMRSAIFACRKGATVVVMGVFGKEVSIPVGLIQDWELRILGSLMYVSDDYKEAIRLLASGQVKVDSLITHRFPLNQARQAFDTALQRGTALKVLIEN
jgi:L-iditol 2-dehydrogenase